MKCTVHVVLSLFAAVLLEGMASPVEKVVKLLEELKTTIEKDGKVEQGMYDKYACWCEETTQRKAKAIEDAKTTLRDTGNMILATKGKVASRTVIIEKTTVDIKENEETQAKATVIRQKENAAWMTETGELKDALAALYKANTVLYKATAPPEKKEALLQRSSHSLEALSQASASLQAAIVAVPAKTLATMPAKKLSLLRQYANELAHSKTDAKYQPQSATIQGILKDMYDEFSADLETATVEESKKNRDFESFIAAKLEELLVLKEKLATAQREKAEAELMLSDATQLYDDTQAQLEADIEFFDVTKESCVEKSKEWEERKKLREQELEGITKALEILSSDEAKETFGKAVKPGYGTFLQVESDTEFASPVVRSAYETLKRSATRTHSLRLARIAAKVRTAKVGHFEEVIKAIDDIIAQLKKEAAEDFGKVDECKEEYTKINSTISDLNWKIEKNEAKIDKLEDLIEKSKEDKAKTIEDIEDTTKQIGDMEDTRKTENQEFLSDKKDDEDAIKLLKEAKEYLADYYNKHGMDVGAAPAPAAAMLQASAPSGFEEDPDEAPDADFSGKGSRSLQSKGIISIMQMIIEDLQGEIATSQKNEEAAQLRFEKELKAAKELKEELEKRKTTLEETIAEKTTEKTDEEQKKTDNEKEKKDEEDYKKKIEPDCDWWIDNEKERTSKRQAELEGLRQAKAYLAGYQDTEAGKEGAALLDKSGRTYRSLRQQHLHATA